MIRQTSRLLDMSATVLRRVKNQSKVTYRRIRKHCKIFRASSYATQSALGYRWAQALQELRKNGYCKLPDSFLSDEIVTDLGKMQEDEKISSNVKFYARLFENISEKNEDDIKFDKFGKLNYELDESVWTNCNKSFVQKLHLLISEYYNQEYWVRNPPTLVLDSASDRKEEYGQSFYHLDWAFHQLSLIILLNSTNNRSTCTRLIKGTNRLIHFLYEIPVLGGSNRYSFVTRKIAQVLEKIMGADDLVGERGTCFLLDAGNSFHKAVYGEDRAMIHFNFAIDKSYMTGGYANKLPEQYLTKRSIAECTATS